MVYATTQDSAEKLIAVWFAGESMENVIVADANPLGEVSSRLVRGLLTAGQEVSGLLDPIVESYIRENRLYMGDEVGG
jgi:nicotinic acid mononucleotide adenylyltransferase